jgi:biotin synthase
MAAGYFSKQISISAAISIARELAYENMPIPVDVAATLIDADDSETMKILAAAAEVRYYFFGNKVKLNYLVNVKSGLCPEDCAYCTQSKVSTASILKYPLLEPETVVEGVMGALQYGVKRVCLVGSGRGPTNHEIQKVSQLIKAVMQTNEHLEVCACFGILREGQAQKLKECGVHAYNHNVNTHKEFYPHICSTHTYEDRVATLQKVKQAGLSPCSGLIVGMGESPDQLALAMRELRELEPDSVPINFLIPVKGTPLANSNLLSPMYCLRVLAVARLMFGCAEVRVAAGRELHLRHVQPLALYVANSMFLGDYLTTKGQKAETDLEMVYDAGMVIDAPITVDPNRKVAVELKQSKI